MSTVKETGEFHLIDRLKPIVAKERPDIIEGIGDDVAVLTTHNDTLLLATVDSQVENIHFLKDRIPPKTLGRRSLAVNLSDIAATGGIPKFALVSLGLPAETETEWVEEMYQGLREESDRYNVAIVGGNMTRSPSGIWVDISVLGQVEKSKLLLRSGAKPGDSILVTGQIGEAAAGLKLLLNSELSVDEAEKEYLIARLFSPTPRVFESSALADTGRVTAMIDISDGLSSDLGHICDRSHVGVRVWADSLPISPETQEVAELSSVSVLQLALAGGEDYELCFTVSGEDAERMKYIVGEEFGTQVSIVGEVVDSTFGRTLFLNDGKELPLNPQGWEHF